MKYLQIRHKEGSDSEPRSLGVGSETEERVPEIAAALEEVELTREQIDDLYAQLVDRSVELVEGERHKYPPHERPALAEEGYAATFVFTTPEDVDAAAVERSHRPSPHRPVRSEPEQGEPF